MALVAHARRERQVAEQGDDVHGRRHPRTQCRLIEPEVLGVPRRAKPPSRCSAASSKGSSPRRASSAATRAGEPSARRSGRQATPLGHEGAIEFLFAWGRASSSAATDSSRSGHRVVHGGLKFTRPVRIDADVLARWSSSCPGAAAPAAQPGGHPGRRPARARSCPRWPASTPRSTAPSRRSPRPSRCRGATPRRACAATASTACRTSTSPRRCPASTPGRRAGRDGRGAPGQRREHVRACAAAGASPARWASPPLDGLPMGTRCGALDPGVLLYLMDRHGMDARAWKSCSTSSRGCSASPAISSDMRDPAGQPETRGRPRRSTCSSTASAASWDRWPRRWAGSMRWCSRAASARTPPPIRARVCRDAAWLGLELDEAANEAGGPRISRAGSRVAAWVIPTNEELMIARHTRRLLGRHGPRGGTEPWPTIPSPPLRAGRPWCSASPTSTRSPTAAPAPSASSVPNWRSLI